MREVTRARYFRALQECPRLRHRSPGLKSFAISFDASMVMAPS
jgi:hypothetical protein